LKEALKEKGVSILAVSCKSREGLDELGKHIFQMLGIMRVYAKEPLEKELSRKPIVVEEGATVLEVAKKLHSNLYRRFKYARIWGQSAKYPGQKVGSDHAMKDEDIIEIH